jgi:hypothetical protein
MNLGARSVSSVTGRRRAKKAILVPPAGLCGRLTGRKAPQGESQQRKI